MPTVSAPPASQATSDDEPNVYGRPAPRVVLVERQNVIKAMVTGMLTWLDPNNEFEFFADADAAMRHLADRGNAVDLVIADLNCDPKGALELAKDMRACPAAKQIPLIAIGKLPPAEALLRGHEFGINEFVDRPIPPDLFRARVRNLLRTSHTLRLKLLAASNTPSQPGDVAAADLRDLAGTIAGIRTLGNGLHASMQQLLTRRAHDGSKDT